MKFIKRLLGLTALIAIAGLALIMLRDLTAPTIELTPGSGPVSAQRPLQLLASDSGAGLHSLTVTLRQGSRSTPLFFREFPPGVGQTEEELSLAVDGLQDGEAFIDIQALDRGHIRFGSGNLQSQTFTFTVDSRPPRVEVLSRQHNLNQGGSGLVVYSVSEPVTDSGVLLGKTFYPGFRQGAGYFVALFAFPWDMSSSDFTPRVVATDLAGNQGSSGFYKHVNSRKFPLDGIRISQSFLENKIVPTFQHLFPEVTDPLQLFLKVNRELREKNLAQIRSLSRTTAAIPLWEGDFLRQPRAATPSSFAQPRTYTFQGEVIDHQTHLGIDLASTRHASILAANAGKVIYADDLGIYGQCVIIDHGLGLQTLYGHMSRIDVQQGDTVSRAQVIGATGTSGLAGGDHLHFDVLVSGTQVNPIEWFDGSWQKNNISGKLQLAREGDTGVGY